MAENNDPNNINVRRFDGSLNDDVKDYHIKENQWSYMRNGTIEFGTNNATNEPANKLCIKSTYPQIGYIYMYDDRWIIFSADGIGSEIGLFKEFTCDYTILITETSIPDLFGNSSRELNFHPNNLITGEAKQNFDCSWNVYWSDKHRNPDRTLNTDDVPWKGVYSFDPNGCRVFTPDFPRVVDGEKLKLNRNVKIPCIKAMRGAAGGNLLNGTYYATIAYTLNGQKVSNYLGLSNAVSLFSHDNMQGALEIELSGLDDSFDEYELTIVSITGNQATVARRIGLYSTVQSKVFLDIIANDLPAVPLEFLPIHNALADSSDSITALGDNLLRISPRSKFDFNYQPQANQITTSWTSVEYPADYYAKGGVNTNHMRDENAALFIRWVYTDGDRSSSYHIPGRGPLGGEDQPVSSIYANSYFFELYNTASQFSTTIIPLDNGGFQIAEGEMGYYETEERYPVDKPDVWGALCGKKIRHHKFPDRSFSKYTDIYADQGFSSIAGPVIRVMGLKCYNIKPPIDNNGDLIKGIVGYEILRGSREGNKTILAKGIVNNMFNYKLQEGDINQDPLDDPAKTNKHLRKIGAYANYPYNSLKNDAFISTEKGETDPLTGILNNLNLNKGWYDKDPGSAGASDEGFFHVNEKFDRSLVTFHSPDTMFKRPALSATELKLDGIVSGKPVLRFYEPDEHPRHKLLTNFAFFIAALGGLALGILKMVGPRSSTNGVPGVGGITGASALGLTALAATGIFLAIKAKRQTTESIDDNYNQFGGIVNARDTNVDGIEAQDRSNAVQASISQSGVMAPAQKHNFFGGGTNSALGILFRGVGGISLFSQQWSEGITTVIDIIQSFSQWQQYALQQISHCFYNHYGSRVMGFNPLTQRLSIKTSRYLDSAIQDFDNDIRINNLYRSRTVVLRTDNGFVPNPADHDPELEDSSKESLQCWPNPYAGQYDDPNQTYRIRTASSYYASLKIRLRNQYGQIGDVKQIPIGCVNNVEIDYTNPFSTVTFETPVIFGGDTYITRYTEKNTMFFFYDWLYKQFDGEEYDYFKSRMLQYPAYWIDSRKFDMGDFVRGLTDNLGGSISTFTSNTPNVQPNLINQPWLPSQLVSLDRPPGSSNVNAPTGSGFIKTAQRAYAYKNSLFIIKAAYYYLFVSGVRDFYVESEINLGYRDWEDPVEKRHFDAENYTDIVSMFSAQPEIIKAGNYYKYDYSLSVSRSFVNMASWGSVQPTYYDPYTAETCYVNHPKRVLYSLPQQVERVRDGWRIFLANNYCDFRSKITTVKSIGDNGAVILSERDLPVQIQGTETLETIRGTKVTIGDGELLKMTQQNLTNADRPYQHGSCQSLRSVVNTPMGLFWISQSQGKIFTVNRGILDIAMQDMHEWLTNYLPYELVKDFPNYDNLDNPVSGVGCQSIYDNRSELIYFTKKDYKFRQESLLPGATIEYRPGTKKIVMILDNNTGGGTGSGDENNSEVEINLHDPLYFEDVSWTFSYDIKSKTWVSWHDWHPDLVMPSQKTFFVIKKDGIWEHNNRCDLFNNFFGVDYPWEIEYPFNTLAKVNTFSSIEFMMEVYKYALNCKDRYLYLEDFFDEAVVFNNEQISGLLKFNNTPFNDPFAELNYPQYNASSVDILYAKVENKYRFNQFSDLTDDRGMFTNARRQMWLTAGNGYHRTLNQQNLNYQKDPLEQKLFRGYQGSVLLRKKVSGDRYFVFLFALNKLLESKR